jgi:glycerol-1-phosphate dehydrogenase [NAD(P)+]
MSFNKSLCPASSMEISYKRHLMELPRAVLIGDGVLDELGTFLDTLGLGKSAGVVSGPKVRTKFERKVKKIIESSGRKSDWIQIQNPSLEDVRTVSEETRSKRLSFLIGLGGGKSVDVAKLAAFEMGVPFLSVPTSASHDGISSPFASIRGTSTPYSHMTKPPIGILADVSIIAECDQRLLASGCGDLIAKVTAVRDWELAHRETNEYYGNYAANLALLSANVVMKEARGIREGDLGSLRSLVEALISAGVAAGIAGSSRPCSGSEHLFCHALEIIAPGKGLHGEKCGLGCIMMCELHGIDGGGVRQALEQVGSPTTARDIGLNGLQVVEALKLAPTIRPERYTILTKARLNERDAELLARRSLLI